MKTLILQPVKSLMLQPGKTQMLQPGKTLMLQSVKTDIKTSEESDFVAWEESDITLLQILLWSHQLLGFVMASLMYGMAQLVSCNFFIHSIYMYILVLDNIT